MRVAVSSMILSGTIISCSKEKEYPKSKYSLVKEGNDFNLDVYPFFPKIFLSKSKLSII